MAMTQIPPSLPARSPIALTIRKAHQRILEWYLLAGDGPAGAAVLAGVSDEQFYGLMKVYWPRSHPLQMAPPKPAPPPEKAPEPEPPTEKGESDGV